MLLEEFLSIHLFASWNSLFYSPMSCNPLFNLQFELWLICLNLDKLPSKRTNIQKLKSGKVWTFNSGNILNNIKRLKTAMVQGEWNTTRTSSKPCHESWLNHHDKAFLDKTEEIRNCFLVTQIIHDRKTFIQNPLSNIFAFLWDFLSDSLHWSVAPKKHQRSVWNHASHPSFPAGKPKRIFTLYKPLSKCCRTMWWKWGKGSVHLNITLLLFWWHLGWLRPKSSASPLFISAEQSSKGSITKASRVQREVPSHRNAHDLLCKVQCETTWILHKVSKSDAFCFCFAVTVSCLAPPHRPTHNVFLNNMSQLFMTHLLTHHVLHEAFWSATRCSIYCKRRSFAKRLKKNKKSHSTWVWCLFFIVPSLKISSSLGQCEGYM